jgi:hypothetical protein
MIRQGPPFLLTFQKHGCGLVWAGGQYLLLLSIPPDSSQLQRKILKKTLRMDRQEIQ